MQATPEPVGKPKSRAPFLLILGGAYALLAVVFVFFPNEFVYLVNVGPKVFKLTEALPSPQDFFWSLMAGAMMAMLSALCFLSAESPRVRGYLLVHLLAKTVCALGFITVFLNQQRFFAYLVGAAFEVVIAAGLLWNEWSGRMAPGATA